MDEYIRAIQNLHNDRIEIIHLSREPNEDIKAKLAALRDNKRVIKLYLMDGHLTTELTQILIEVFRHNNSIRFLNLTLVQVDNSDLSQFFHVFENENSTLGSLTFRGYDSNIIKLNSLAKMLTMNRSITRLDLAENILSNESIESLAESLEINTTLVYLNLSYCKFALGHMKYIIDTVKHSTSLKSLELMEVMLNDDDMFALGEFLKMNSNLEELDLESCQFSLTGFKFMTRGLEDNSSITRLHMNGCKIDFQRLVKVFDHNFALEMVNFTPADDTQRRLIASLTHRNVLNGRQRRQDLFYLLGLTWQAEL